MPDPAELLLLAALALAAGAFVARPLLRRRGAPAPPVPADRESLALRHRLALEAMLDVEADHRAGSLDDASYQRQLAEAEGRAAATLAVLEAPAAPLPDGPRTRGTRPALLVGAGLSLALLVGQVLPAPFGLGERTTVNQALADQIAAEQARQDEIQRLLALLEADPTDPRVLSDLADAYLAGSTAQDLQRAAVALLVMLAVEPDNASAYRRLITAYLSANDLADARAATDSYRALVGADEPDIPFFLGLIALRSGDASAAIEEFNRFLLLAPEDDRAAMVRSLRQQALDEAES